MIEKPILAPSTVVVIESKDLPITMLIGSGVLAGREFEMTCDVSNLMCYFVKFPKTDSKFPGKRFMIDLSPAFQAAMAALESSADSE